MAGLRLALAGDTMLGRQVAHTIRNAGSRSLVADEVAAVAREADLFVLNLECCISERGERWPDPQKPFFFRAPPAATELLQWLGVDCVTLANNHSLDYGHEALLDTLERLHDARVATVGAGRNLAAARSPAVLEHNGFRLAVLGCSDHPAAYAASPDRPGIAYGFEWLPEAIGRLDADAVLVTPHWGPNMVAEPQPARRREAEALLAAGATLIAGHSAHVFHGVAGGVLYDLGDFLDDYAVDAQLRNDLGLLFVVELDPGELLRIEAVPLKLEFCHTRMADGDDAAWIRRRFEAACAGLGTRVRDRGDRLVVDPHR